jgi:hypothetical protein
VIHFTDVMSVIYRQATAADTSALVRLLGDYEDEIRRKLLLPPRLYREQFIIEKIRLGRLWLAEKAPQCDPNSAPISQPRPEIVGFKSLYVMASEQERAATLRKELKIQQAPVVYHAFRRAGNGEWRTGSHDVQLTLPTDSVYVYSGSDFTIPSERRKGINKNLLLFALRELMAAIPSSTSLAFVCGVTPQNQWHSKATFDNILQGLTLAARPPSAVSQVVYKTNFYVFDPDSSTFDFESAVPEPGLGCLMLVGQGNAIPACGHA